MQGGGLQACPQDSSLPLGVIHSFAQGVVQFDSHAFHCTQPWKGERTILVGFVVKGFQAFQPELIQSLSHCAFNLPAIGTADMFGSSESSVFPVVLELFSGMGRLTAQLRSRGATGSVAVDKAAIANAAAPPLHLDVCSNYQLLCSWLQSAHVLGVHLAPPLGVPQPLAQAILAIVTEAARLGHLVSIELPASASLWSSPAGGELLKLCPHHFEFCLCDFGEPCALTQLASNRDAFQSLQRGLSSPCRKPAALSNFTDRTYPWTLAAKLADAFVPRRLVTAPPQLASARAATLSQPKASKFPAPVSEHQQVVLVTGPSGWPVSCMARLKSDLPLPPSASCVLRVLPADAQLLRVTLAAVNRGEPRSGGELKPDSEASQTTEWISAWGIPRSPEEFVKAAIKAGHPCQMEAALPKALQQAIDRNASTSAEQLARSRALFFKKWLARAKELEPEEQKFKASLPEHVAAILAPKRLLLWKELLEHYQYPDQQVFQEVTEGIKLTGQTPATGIFPPTFKPALRQEADLPDWAPSARSRVFDRVRPQGAVDSVVHEKTLEERDKGWAKGPVCRDSLQGSSLVSRRFGLRQGEKTRLVDDLSFSGVNELVTVQESPKPHGPDVVAASMLAFMKAAPGVPLEGRPYDLRSAYRQLPIHPDSLQHAFVAHWNPVPATVEVDQLLALPFGASRSVFGFIRAATSIWWLGCVALGICWSVFFDDFITISKSEDVKHTEAAVCTFFRMLGWLFDDCGSKAVNFSSCFKALGVMFNLSQARHGFITLSNTPARVAELTGLITDLLSTRTLTRAEAQHLRGRGACSSVMVSCLGELLDSACKQFRNMCIQPLTSCATRTCGTRFFASEVASNGAARE